MSGNNKHTKFSDFLKYLKGDLSSKERNWMEKIFQKDPFEQEAEEGMQNFTADILEEDLLELNSRLNNKPVKRNRFIYAGWAATIAVILTVTTLYFTLSEKKMEDIPANKGLSESVDIPPETPPLLSEFDENGTKTESAKETKNLPSEEDVENRGKKADPVEISENLPDAEEEVAEAGAIVAPEEKLPEDNRIIEDSSKPAKSSSKKSREPENNIISQLQRPLTSRSAGAPESASAAISGIVRSAEDSIPLPGVEISETESGRITFTDKDGLFTIPESGEDTTDLMAEYAGMKKVEIKKDEDDEILEIFMEPLSSENRISVTIENNEKKISEALALSERTRKKYTDFKEATPVNGEKAFINYLNENQQFPETDDKDTEVILEFIITMDGKPSEIDVVRSPGRKFSREAVRLLREGPLWNPARSAGEYEKTLIRIKFNVEKVKNE